MMKWLSLIPAFILLFCVLQVSAAPPSDALWEKWRLDVLNSAKDEMVDALTAKPQDQEFQEQLLCGLIEDQFQTDQQHTPNYVVNFILNDNSKTAVTVYAEDDSTAEYYAYCKYRANKKKDDVLIKNLDNVIRKN